MPSGTAVLVGTSGTILTFSIGQPVGRITATMLSVGTGGGAGALHVHLTCDNTDPVPQTTNTVMNNSTQTLPNVAGQSISFLPPILGGQPSNTIIKLLCTATTTMPSVLLEW